MTQDVEGYRETVWKLNQMIGESWEMGQVKISRDYDFYVVIEVTSTKGEAEGQIAIDDFKTIADEACPMIPAQAEPATTPKPTTTPNTEPTEPPGRKKCYLD